jgi:hypothetical protein
MRRNALAPPNRPKTPVAAPCSSSSLPNGDAMPTSCASETSPNTVRRWPPPAHHTSRRQHPNRNIGPGWQQTGPRPRTQPVTNRAHAAASPPRRAHQLDARRTNRHSSERCAAQSVVEYGLGPSYKLRVREFALAFPISRNRVCSLRQFLAVVALPLWHQPCAFPGFGEARTPFLQSVAPKGPHGLCGRRCQ